jgi:cell division protein ZapB|tara:strand:+ start:41 stop:247 length:207 start_codon:yes stop_codon:yes gene_type:complete
MSKISKQLESLKLSINSIKDKMQKIEIENALLLKQQTGLVTEKSELIKKNESAREEIEAVLERIKNIE